MATVNDLPPTYLPHIERTARQPRHNDLHAVTLGKITSTAGGRIRLLQLDIQDKARGIQPPQAVKFLPGQWLDVHIPTLLTPGGFTITSSPLDARPVPPTSTITPTLELAVQHSPKNPAAAYLFRPEEQILGMELHVRVGGSFVWPPMRYLAGRRGELPRRAVFVAGGVGINPLMAMLTHMNRTNRMPQHVHVLYSIRRTSPPALDDAGAGSLDALADVLFAKRLRDIATERVDSMTLDFYMTRGEPAGTGTAPKVLYWRDNVSILDGKMTEGEIEEALGPVEERGETVCYVCGPQKMTDEIVEMVGKVDGMDGERVLCEKWW